MLQGLPRMLEDARKATAMLAEMAGKGGLRLDAETIAQLARARRQDWVSSVSLAVAALALTVIAARLVF